MGSQHLQSRRRQRLSSNDDNDEDEETYRRIARRVVDDASRKNVERLTHECVESLMYAVHVAAEHDDGAGMWSSDEQHDSPTLLAFRRLHWLNEMVDWFASIRNVSLLTPTSARNRRDTMIAHSTRDVTTMARDRIVDSLARDSWSLHVLQWTIRFALERLQRRSVPAARDVVILAAGHRRRRKRSRSMSSINDDDDDDDSGCDATATTNDDDADERYEDDEWMKREIATYREEFARFVRETPHFDRADTRNLLPRLVSFLDAPARRWIRSMPESRAAIVGSIVNELRPCVVAAHLLTSRCDHYIGQ